MLLYMGHPCTRPILKKIFHPPVFNILYILRGRRATHSVSPRGGSWWKRPTATLFYFWRIHLLENASLREMRALLRYYSIYIHDGMSATCTSTHARTHARTHVKTHVKTHAYTSHTRVPRTPLLNQSSLSLTHTHDCVSH